MKDVSRLLHFISLFLFSGCLCLTLRRRFDNVLPAVLSALMLVLTVFAMLGRLYWADALAVFGLAVSAGLVAFMLTRGARTFGRLGKDVLTYVLTPGFACFALLCTFLWYATGPMVVWWWDDVAYWAMEPKSLWALNGLAGASDHWALAYATYTPGIQVLQWWVMHAVGEWRESLLYFTLFITYGAYLLPLCSRLRWKHFYLIPVFFIGMIALPAWGNAASYTSLSVDTALAICFGYVLVQIWRLRERDGWGLCSIALGLCALVLIKQTGALLALLAILFFLLMKRWQTQRRPAVLAALLSPLAAVGAWMLFCRLSGLSGRHTESLLSALTAVLSGSYMPPEGYTEVLPSLLQSLTGCYCEAGSFYDGMLEVFGHPTVCLPLLVRLALVIMGPLCLSRRYSFKRMGYVSLFCAGAFLINLVVQYLGFFTVFAFEIPAYTGPQSNNMLLLMERYLSPMVLGFGLLLVWLLFDAPPSEKRSGRSPVILTATILSLLAFTVNWTDLREILIPYRYIQKDRALGTEGVVMMDNDWGAQLEGYGRAKVLVGYEPNSSFIKDMDYVFAPARFEAPQPTVTQNAAALSSYLLQNGFTHLFCPDEASLLYAPALGLMEEGEEFYTYTLYEITPSGNGLVLTEAE